MSTIIVIQGRNLREGQGHTYLDRIHTYTYSLAKPLNFTEPHYARLLYVGNATITTFVFADFVERQHVSGEPLPYLGCTAKQGCINPWVPLASNHIPSFGYVQLRPADSRYHLEEGSRQSIVIQVASESFLNGTAGKDKL